MRDRDEFDDWFDENARCETCMFFRADRLIGGSCMCDEISIEHVERDDMCGPGWEPTNANLQQEMQSVIDRVMADE